LERSWPYDTWPKPGIRRGRQHGSYRPPVAENETLGLESPPLQAPGRDRTPPPQPSRHAHPRHRSQHCIQSNCAPPPDPAPEKPGVSTSCRPPTVATSRRPIRHSPDHFRRCTRDSHPPTARAGPLPSAVPDLPEGATGSRADGRTTSLPRPQTGYPLPSPGPRMRLDPDTAPAAYSAAFQTAKLHRSGPRGTSPPHKTYNTDPSDHGPREQAHRWRGLVRTAARRPGLRPERAPPPWWPRTPAGNTIQTRSTGYRCRTHDAKRRRLLLHGQGPPRREAQEQPPPSDGDRSQWPTGRPY